MSKNLQWILNVIFVLGIGYLFWNQSAANDAEEKAIKPEEEKIDNEGPLEVRYVNTDTIWANYKYVEEMRSNLSKKQKEYRMDLESRVAAFEKEVIAFQEEAPQMSQFAGEQKQKELIEKEQELGRLQEDLSVKLMEMEDKMKRDLRMSILNHLKKYQDEEVDLVLDFSANSSLLMIEDSLNITKRVLEGLNQEYQAKKEKK